MPANSEGSRRRLRSVIARRFPLVICLLALCACGGRDAACSKPASRTAHERIPAQASDPPLPAPPSSGNESPPRQEEIASEDRVDEILELGDDPDRGGRSAPAARLA